MIGLRISAVCTVGVYPSVSPLEPARTPLGFTIYHFYHVSAFSGRMAMGFRAVGTFSFRAPTAWRLGRSLGAGAWAVGAAMKACEACGLFYEVAGVHTHRARAYAKSEAV